MMKFKKLTAVAAAAVVAVSFVGCGGSSSSSSASSSAASSAAAQSGEKTKLYVVNWKDYGSDDAEFMKEFEEAHKA